MKKTCLLFAFVALSFMGALGSLTAQVVINEISYNSPESGNDSLEYVEILNAGNAMINIGGWYFSSGIEDTFPDVDLHPGEYFVTALSASAMLNVFGVTAHQWVGGALNNGGELLTLVDNGGGIVDSVRYDDADPWPVEPDGNGPSLELVDSALDNNDGANWQFSGTGTGMIINGFEVKGTPGAENSGGGTPGPAVTIEVAHFEFTPKHVVVETGETVRWVNQEATAHNINGNQSFYPNNPESFGSGAPAPGIWEYNYIPLTAGLYNYHCDPHLASGMVGTVSAYDPLNYTDFPLTHLRLTNEGGSALFDGVPTTVTGVVHGVNFQPTGYSFFIMDENNVGINVFSFDPGTYVVKEGDNFKVFGTIDQFNGLLEIIPDQIEVMSDANTLNTPRLVSEITEADESSYLVSELLKVDSVGSISAAGFNVYTTNTLGEPLLIRVDTDANIGFGPDELFPGAWINVTGIGTQFDNSFPFTSGYQMLALEINILIDGLPILDQTAIKLNPNPASNIIRLSSELIMDNVEVYTMEGKLLVAESVHATQTEIDINTLPVGLHLVKAITADGIWTSLVSVIR
jgi:plastocyanin